MSKPRLNLHAAERRVFGPGGMRRTSRGGRGPFGVLAVATHDVAEIGAAAGDILAHFRGARGWEIRELAHLPAGVRRLRRSDLARVAAAASAFRVIASSWDRSGAASLDRDDIRRYVNDPRALQSPNDETVALWLLSPVSEPIEAESDRAAIDALLREAAG